MFIDPSSYHVSPATRIISLVPSITELLADLDLAAETIAITKFCIHPEEWFRTKRRIGGTKNLHVEEIIALAPDLVIANKEENVRDQVLELAKHVPVLLTDVNNLRDALIMIHDIGNLTGRASAAEQMIQQIEAEFSAIQKPVDPPSVAYLIWNDPMMVAANDTFINDMISQAGLRNCYDDLSRYPEITEDSLLSRSPDLIFLSTEPYPFDSKHVASFSQRFPSGKVKLVDGEMFSWYGSHLLHVPRYVSQLHI